MAFATILHTAGQSVETVTVTATVDTDNDTYDFAPEHPMRAMTIQTIGDDGGGTTNLLCGNDGTNFVALPTAKSMTAAGVLSVVQADLGFKWYRIELTGSTNPTLTIIVNMSYNQ